MYHDVMNFDTDEKYGQVHSNGTTLKSFNIEGQCLLGMQCSDFAMIAADQTTTQSIIVLKNDENKLYEVTDKLIFGIVGEQGDAVQFAQFVSKNLQLYLIRNNYGLDVAAAVHFARKNLADGFGNGLNLLVAGHDDQLGGQLFSLEMLASCVKVPYGGHGFGGLLSMGILDRYYNYALTQAQAYGIMELCVQEIHQRLFLSLPNFQVKVVSKTGITELPTINCFSLLTSKK